MKVQKRSLEFLVLRAASEKPGLQAQIDPASLGIAVGDPAQADSVIRAEDRVIDQVRRQGHPFAAVSDRRVVVDHATREMNVKLRVEPGPRALFGEVAIEGLETMEGDFVRQRGGVMPGNPYSPDALRAIRDNLAALEVFSRIRVETADVLDNDARLPVTVTVTERPRRVIGFGADFNSSEGFGGHVRWGHRNLFGRAESLRLQAEIGRVGKNAPGDIDYDLSVRYLVPDFLIREQNLRAEASAGRENPDAFRREAIEAYVGVDRRLSETLDLSAGIKIERSNVDDSSASATLLFASLPLGLRLDTSDDLLNPTRGYRLALELRPYFVDRTFLRTDLAASTVYDVREEGGLVLAVRARLGAIVGEQLLAVPSDKRFFSGGGGSVRGFAYQAIGPRTEEDDPLGGRSLFELGFEARVRLSERIGLVPFVEGGQVFEEGFPSFEADLQFGAGLGLRYFTAIGPLRFDVAFPIDKREGDDDFQVYVSFGQAF